MRGKDLTLAFPQLHARATLKANGLEMTGLVPEMSVGWRGTDQPRWRIPKEQVPDTGELALEVTVPYRMVMSGWIDVAPRLSDTEEGDRAFVAMADFNRTQSVTCSIAVLITSFTYAIVWGLNRRRAAYGWFALQGIIGGGGYAILVEGVSQRLFGVYEHCFVPFFLCIGVATSVEFSHAQFGLPRPSRLSWWAVAVCAVLAVLFVNPFVGPRIVPAWSCFVVTANVAYQIPLAARVWLTRGRPLAALVILISWVALGILGFPDIVTWSGLGELLGGLRGACWGFFLVAFLQSLVMSVEHHRTLGRADELNRELATRVDALSAKNAEVLHLNDELRRQIGARADALALALAQASAPRADGLRSLEPGEIVAKRYRVERAVGEGATGKVYEVTRLSDERHLALKLLDPASDATEMARFAREAQLISQMDHPNVIGIADVDITHEGFFYLVVEFVEGLSLRHHYGRARTLAWSVSVLSQVAEGLAAIHARGIVHRDLKPANLFLTDDAGSRTVKVLDFGISKITNDGDAHLTGTFATIGTPIYMSPEQVRSSKDVDSRTDIWALGVILYECLTGQPPFQGSMTATAAAIVADEPAPLRTLRPDVSPELENVIFHALEKSPAKRFPDIQSLGAALAAYGPKNMPGASGDWPRSLASELPPPVIRKRDSAGSGDFGVAQTMPHLDKTVLRSESAPRTVAQPRRSVPLIVGAAALVSVTVLAAWWRSVPAPAKPPVAASASAPPPVDSAPVVDPTPVTAAPPPTAGEAPSASAPPRIPTRPAGPVRNMNPGARPTPARTAPTPAANPIYLP
jgi:serine/threonine-protein kinase